MIVSIVVAAAENGIIGAGNQLPWRLPADLKYFRKLTTGHPVIMGRKTFDSIGKPLKDRTNIVLSQSVGQIEGCIVKPNLREALEFCRPESEVFIIGGGTVYAEALAAGLVDRIYLTRVHHEVEGDTFFRLEDETNWKVVSTERHEADETHAWPYSFIRLDRISG
jgi:dihydrofolate reductase